MDIKKILTDLKYRISVTSESDPEYKNAVSLFERLKRKYNINESDLNARKVDLTDEEYLNVTKKYEYLIHVWDRQLKKIEEDLKKEQEKRIAAARYSFLDKGNLLKKVSSTEEKEPSF